jgi:hypothetical protein
MLLEMSLSLRNILPKIFNAAYNEGVLSRSMKSGVISLIYKKKGDRRCIRNYRPIYLLQVDSTLQTHLHIQIFLKH